MNPNEPNEPLPTTPVGPPSGAPPASTEPPRWWAPPPAWGPPPGWGGPPGGWGVPPPAPPRRDRLALGVVAFIFGGLFLVFFGFLLLAYSAVRGESPRLSSGPQIGVVEVKGEIGMGPGGVDAPAIMKQLKKLTDDGSIKAIVVRIDSPGGAVGTSQEIFDQVKKAALKKPVVCSMGNVAASGGFYIAMGCQKVVAEAGTMTGSIGVISMFPNLKGLAQRFDVRMEILKSGKLKAAGNPFADMTPEERAYMQALVDRIYGQFVSAVSEAREIDEDEVRGFADGRVITGDQAKELGLVDALGNFYDAVDLAKREAKLTGEPHLVWPPDDRARFLDQLMGDTAGAAARAVTRELASEARAAERPGLYLLAR